MHRPQPAATLARMEAVLSAESDHVLAAVNTLTSLASSLVIALAALAPDADAETLWDVANLEEDWQASLWGKDYEAEERRAHRLAVFETAMDAILAVVEHGPRDVPWRDDLAGVIRSHSRNPDYDPDHSLINALRDAGHFEPIGHTETAPITFRQPVAYYIEQFHSTSSLARELMSAEEAAEFDRAIEAVVAPWREAGWLELTVVATIDWGRPLASGQGTL